ncbi:histidine phosphatase family protein [Streptosporangium soli]|nr:histidine phosphatase family protein [Streptosporangium sp. KLBMP 9127]
MLFVRQASTPAMRAARFPADEPADPASLTRAAAARPPWPIDGGRPPAVWVAPVTAARQTAAAFGWAPIEAPELAEADPGRWRGRPYAQIAQTEPDALATWLADPDAAPHGGESQAGLANRVAGWLDAVAPGCVVVCDVGVVRAALGHALGLGPVQTARFDLAPLSTTELVHSRGGWRVAHINRKAIT